MENSIFQAQQYAKAKVDWMKTSDIEVICDIKKEDFCSQSDHINQKESADSHINYYREMGAAPTENLWQGSISKAWCQSDALSGSTTKKLGQTIHG